MQTNCLEYERLRVSYELAVKTWVQTMLSFDAELVGLAGMYARQRRQKAFAERNTADDLITAHELVCSRCKRKIWKVIAGSHEQGSIRQTSRRVRIGNETADLSNRPAQI
jgi:hypothetical protein